MSPGSDDPSSLREHCTCGILRRAARDATALYDEALRPSGLRVTQFAILRILLRQGPLPIHRLAAEAALERTTMARNLDPLERRGLVEIAPDPTDARHRLAALTETGRLLLAEAIPRWRMAQDEIGRRIDPEAVRALAAALSAP